MLNLIKYLSKKPRVAGSKRGKEIANFLVKELNKIGYKTWLQKHNFTGWDLIQKPKLKINDKNVKCLPVLWSGSGNIKGKLIPTTRTKTFEAYEWLRWKIVDKNKTKGYIISRPDVVWLQLVDKKSNLPYFMVYPDTCKQLREGKNFKVEASVKSKFLPKQKIQNIITKNNSKNKIVICAHYDSILNAPGANDNASGVAALMELSKKYKNNKKIQFILFDAEEWNKYGSYSYVRSLCRRRLNKIKVVINLDMIGSGNPYILASKKFNPVIKNSIKKLKYKKIQIGNDLRPPFDYWPFYKKKIPIIHFGAAPYNYCHDEKDTIDKISMSPIKKVINICSEIIDRL